MKIIQISDAIFGAVYKISDFAEIDEETLDFFAIFVYDIYVLSDSADLIVGRMSA